jgi:hypothetical protein
MFCFTCVTPLRAQNNSDFKLQQLVKVSPLRHNHDNTGNTLRHSFIHELRQIHSIDLLHRHTIPVFLSMARLSTNSISKHDVLERNSAHYSTKGVSKWKNPS